MNIVDNLLKEALEIAISESVWKKEGKPDKVRKFDESLDLIVNFRDVDLKDPNFKFNQEFLLPNAIHLKKLSICFISKGDQLLEAKEKGYTAADEGFLSDINKKDKKFKKGFVGQFENFVCAAPLMRNVAKTLGRFLGQTGKMPKPLPNGYGIVKIDESVDKIINNFRRRIILKSKKDPMIQTLFGKKSLKLDDNLENLKALIHLLEEKMPNGQGNIKSIYLKTTMGKSIRVKEPAAKVKGGHKK